MAEDKKAARMQQAIHELIAPAERFIVAVEEAAAPKYVMPRIVQAVDPKYHRTIFVYTKFQVGRANVGWSSGREDLPRLSPLDFAAVHNRST
jgi:hypothetical protein